MGREYDEKWLREQLEAQFTIYAEGAEVMIVEDRGLIARQRKFHVSVQYAGDEKDIYSPNMWEALGMKWNRWHGVV